MKRYCGTINLVIITKPIEAENEADARRKFGEDVNYIDNATVDDVPSLEVEEVTEVA